MKNTIMVTVSAAALTAGQAIAGNFDPAPPPVPVAPIAPAGPDWTGFYLGAEGGYIDIGSNVPGVSGDGGIIGVIAGYDYDLGRTVIGVGLDYDWLDVTLVPAAFGPNVPPTPAVKAENVFRAKLRSGFKTNAAGTGLLYLTGGYALVDTTVLGSEDGWFLGLGYDHLINEKFSVGGEVLYHEFDNVNNTVLDVDATTVQIRGAYRF